MNKASVAWGAERGEDGVERRGGGEGAASVVSPARPGEGVRVFRVKNAGAPLHGTIWKNSLLGAQGLPGQSLAAIQIVFTGSTEGRTT